MGEYFIQGNTLTAIADAIRAKTGGENLMTPAEMAQALNDLTITAPEYEVTVSQQTTNGITTYIYQWDRLVILYWDGAPKSTMSKETWYTVATGLPQNVMTMLQPVYTSCFNWYEYSAQLSEQSTLRLYPRGGAITSSDKLRGQLVYITVEADADE